MTDDFLIPAGWQVCEIEVCTIEYKVLQCEILLSSEKYFRWRVDARLDLRRAQATVILQRIFSAVGLQYTVHDSGELQGRALSLHLAIERDSNVIVDAKPLTSPK
jgi:hypothetical protein